MEQSCQSYFKGILKLISRPGEVMDISVVNVDLFLFIFKIFNVSASYCT